MQITLNDRTKSRGTINHPPCLTWFPLLIPWSKQNIHLWHIWVWYHGYEIWLCFWECWTPPIWCSVISWACKDDKVPGWQLAGGSWKTVQSGSDILFYTLFWLISVVFCTCWQSKNLFLKVAWEPDPRDQTTHILKNYAILCQMQAGGQGAFLYVFVYFPVLQMSGKLCKSIWKSQIWAFFFFLPWYWY